MQIHVNGTLHEVAEVLSLNDLLELLELGGKRIAVEVNQELVPRSRFLEHRLSDQDRVEIIQAVGGG
jgi:sulfur carrier protein